MSTPDPLREHDDSRAAFLAGEGTLTVAQVQEWAVELSDSTFADLTDDATPLMVSVVRPVEPEAWEWRACADDTLDEPDPEEEVRACSFEGAAALLDGFEAEPLFEHRWVERRRPGTAPGEWERVDPEPREES